MVTTTLYKIIQSELFKQGNNEFEGDSPNTSVFPLGKFNYYDDNYQFLAKVLKYDDDVESIVNWLFNGLSLNKDEFDLHFKKAFIYRFANRQINKQTIESFKMDLITTFLVNEDFINRMYEDVDLFLTQTGENSQKNIQESKHINDSTSTTDNRQAYADLPQSSTNLNVDDDVMKYATDNTISKNKQTNKQKSDDLATGTTRGSNKSYHLDELMKTKGMLENILDLFDRKCFLQVF